MPDETEPDHDPLGMADWEVVSVGTVDLTELGFYLDRARETFATDPQEGLGIMLTALAAVVRVTDPDMRRGHRDMMAKLLTAVADLRRGRQPELLSKAKLGHRPRQSLDEWRVRANAAHVADLLEGTGLSADEANRAIARVLDRNGVEVGRQRRGALPADVVARWRADLAAGRAPRI